MSETRAETALECLQRFLQPLLPGTWKVGPLVGPGACVWRVTGAGKATVIPINITKAGTVGDIFALSAQALDRIKEEEGGE